MLGSWQGSAVLCVLTRLGFLACPSEGFSSSSDEGCWVFFSLKMLVSYLLEFGDVQNTVAIILLI